MPVSQISITSTTSSDNIWKVKEGENFMRFYDSLNIDGKETCKNEAMDILSRCIKPGTEDSVTNIAVGYVQSGKTLSFTMLSTLAADNDFRVIIYLTGTTTNLQDQTYKRLRKDLDIENNFESYTIFEDNLNGNTDQVIAKAKQMLQTDDDDEKNVLLFPILKHYSHIEALAKVFDDPQVKNLLGKQGVLIIDDEADQSSFNTYARKNAKNKANEDWTEDEFSSTYSSILNLRSKFSCLSYVQYTATPQAAFLIDNNDILSPKYHTVLTPGMGYTGGQFFFNNKDGYQLIKEIKSEEVYHHKNNPFTKRPSSLDKALMEFFVSVAIVVRIEKREKFLTMMVHPDGLCETNSKFFTWVSSIKSYWQNTLNAPDGDPAKDVLKKIVKLAYDSITEFMQNPPVFDEVYKNLKKVFKHTALHLVQTGGEKIIDWEGAYGHILVGADMLNRGFTVEKLSMTYMPRTTKSKSTADTIEQRCRFFGYKSNYADVCRIYLPKSNIEDYEAYIEHEENMRNMLKSCTTSTLAEYSKKSTALVLDPRLKATRTNILTSKVVSRRLSNWRQMKSYAEITNNGVEFDNFISLLVSKNAFVNDTEYLSAKHNHRHIDIDVDEFVEFFRKIKYYDVPNITRKIATIQYLIYLKENLGIYKVRVYEMAYKTNSNANEELRSHKKSFSNMLEGHAIDMNKPGAYIGDREFKSEEYITFQIHHYKIDAPFDPLDGKTVYNLAIYYPEVLATNYISTASADEEDDEIM